MVRLAVKAGMELNLHETIPLGSAHLHKILRSPREWLVRKGFPIPSVTSGDMINSAVGCHSTAGRTL